MFLHSFLFVFFSTCLFKKYVTNAPSRFLRPSVKRNEITGCCLKLRWSILVGLDNHRSDETGITWMFNIYLPCLLSFCLFPIKLWKKKMKWNFKKISQFLMCNLPWTENSPGICGVDLTISFGTKSHCESFETTKDFYFFFRFLGGGKKKAKHLIMCSFCGCARVDRTNWEEFVRGRNDNKNSLWNKTRREDERRREIV